MGFEWSASDDVFAPAQGPLERAGLERIGRYEIRERVGAGGMGAVYRCWDPEARREVALKVLLAGSKATEPQRRRFRREAEALGRLAHPNLLSVHAGGEQGGTPFLVTEWLDAETLADRLDREETLPLRESLELIRALAGAMAYAHGQGVLHRDIKPSNVLLHPQRGPILIDFGLAKGTGDFSQSRLTVTGAFAGTPGYAAPEQINDASSADERSDVFSLGATLYALLTGKPPAHGCQTMAELLARLSRGRFPPPSKLRRDVPRAVDTLVLEALAPEPAERIPDARAMGRRVSALLERNLEPRSSRAALGALALVALAFGAGAWFAQPASSSTSHAAASPSLPAAVPSPSAAAPSPGYDEIADEAAEAWRQVVALPKQEGQGPILSPADAKARAERLTRAQNRAIAALLRALEQAPTPRDRHEALWTLGSACNAAGRYDEAIEHLEQVGRGEYLARARLTLAVSYEARDDPKRRDPLAAREALRRAAAAGSEAAPDTEERVAGLLAELSLQAYTTPAEVEPVERLIERVHHAVTAKEIPFPWLATEAWFTLLRLRFPQDPRFYQHLANRIADVEDEVSLPFWSQAWGYRWLRGFGARLPAPVIMARLETLATAQPQRITHLLANSAAQEGLLATLERLAALPQPLPDTSLNQQLTAARQFCERVAGPIVTEFGEGYTPLVLAPSAGQTHVLFRVPPDATAWELRLRGAQLDLDLRLRYDGAPGERQPLQFNSHSMAFDEAVGGPAPTTTGVHQALILRPAWAEPVAVALELRVARGEEQLTRWRDARQLFALDLSQAATIAVRRAQADLAFGRIDEGFAALDRLRGDSPELFLIRALFCDYAARWGELRELRPPANARAEARVALAWGQAEAARQVAPKWLESELRALLDLDPFVLSAHEELAVARLRRGAPAEASQALDALLRPAERQPTLRALRATAQLLAKSDAQGDYALAQLSALADHPRARRLAARALLPARPDLALRVLRQADPSLRVVADALLEVEALLETDQRAEAQERLRQLRERSLSPRSRSVIEALEARAKQD